MEILLVMGLAVIFVSILLLYRLTNAKIQALNAQMIESRTLQGQTTESFGHIQSSLGRLTEASRHMEQVGKEIAGLRDILRTPKFRGGIGELLLADLLSQILSPEHYKLQYGFKSGERVDAVIILKVGMVPVDAKFPLESFQRMTASPEGVDVKRYRREFTRAVKTHVDSIAQKYIVPDEGTFDFALMYIPAENVYYETIIRDEGLGEERSLLDYALQRRVIPVSPNSFYAYLQAIALGLKGLQIEKKAQEIMRHLSRIESDFDRFKEEYGTLGGHLERTRKKYEDASKSLDRFGDKLLGARDPSTLVSEPDGKTLDAGKENKHQ